MMMMITYLGFLVRFGGFGSSTTTDLRSGSTTTDLSLSLSLYGISLTLSLYGWFDLGFLGRDVVVEVWAGMWWWRWWQGCGGGGGGGMWWWRWWQGCGRRGLPRRGSKKTWNHVCVVKRSRRPFLMKGLRENKQAADSKPLRASARRRHKWPEALLAKKQTEPRGPMIEKDGVGTYPSQVLFIAAKMNNTRFLVELIREYPDLIWKTNDDGQTIFHVAVAHRHHDIYNLLYEIGSMKDLITPMTDKDGNNILHLVGMKPEKNIAYEDRITYAIQMFDEFSWYKEVKGILPPLYREVKNATGETPQELFTKNHENLVSKGMESINESINIFMVVSTLVCAIGFSVVFQIPGGFDQDNGFPMFLHNWYFIVFLVLDVFSFLYASYSIVLFLSVILSPKRRGMESLLKRWMEGTLALLFSVLCLVLAFCFSFCILYLNSSLLKRIIYGPAFIIITSPIIFKASIAMTDTKFSPKKHTLYRKKN